MDIDKKEILQYISKYGGDPDEPPAVPSFTENKVSPTGPGAEAETVTGTETSSDDSPAVPSFARKKVSPAGPYVKPIVNTNIAEMQAAIYNLGKNISADTTHFNDFMVESYSNQSLIKGEEWDPALVYPELKTRKPTELIQLSNVITQLQSIGSKSNPKDPDGVWNFRTQNSVKNVWALGDTLLRVSEDFGSNLRNPPFTADDLHTFATNIPSTPLGDPDKIKNTDKKDLALKAAVIAPLVDKLTSFYMYFFKKVLSNPDVRKYINDKNSTIESFKLTLKPTNPASMQPTSAQIAGQILKDIKLPKFNDKEIWVDIPLVVLQNQTSLQKFLYDVLDYSEAQVVSPNLQLKILGMIKSQANAQIAS